MGERHSGSGSKDDSSTSYLERCGEYEKEQTPLSHLTLRLSGAVSLVSRYQNEDRVTEVAQSVKCLTVKHEDLSLSLY